MALIPLKLPAGLFQNGTRLQAAGRWFSANLIRFYESTIRPIGGWAEYAITGAALSGSVRSVLAWRANDNAPILAIGTNTNLYAVVASVAYDITPAGLVTGQVDTAAAVGAYGLGAYGVGPYGIGDPSLAVMVDAAVWRLDTFGEHLVGVLAPSDGGLYEWDRDTGTDAAAVVGAPTGNVGVVVTAERFVLVLGADGNPRAVAWPSQETLTDWTPTAVNTAGSWELTTEGKLVCGRRVRGGTLLFTDVDVHLVRYVGPPFYLGRERIGTGGIVGPNAVAVVDRGAIWMSQQGFMAFDGSVQPLPCDVADAVFGDFNRQQGAKVQAVVQAEFGEVWFFYPSALSLENDKYVVFNYREGHWTTGTLARAAGVDRGVFSRPLMLTDDGTIYEHETGFAYDGETPYVESGPVQIARGEVVMSATALIPDENTLGDAQVRIYTSMYPTASETENGPYTLEEKTDVRLTARHVRLRIEGVNAVDWRAGDFMLDAQPGSRR